MSLVIMVCGLMVCAVVMACALARIELAAEKACLGPFE